MIIRRANVDDTPGTAVQREMVLNLLDAYIDFIQQKLGPGLKEDMLILFAQVEQSLRELRHRVITIAPDRLSQAEDAVSTMICEMLLHLAEATGNNSLKAMVTAYERQHDLMELSPRRIKPTLH